MSASNNLPAKPQPKPKPGAVKVVRALYNYTARYPDELSFEEGDILYVYDRTNPEWWKATCGSKKGLIPSNYVESKLDEIPNPLHEAARRGNLSFLKECLSQKVSSTGLDKMGNTPLYWASHSGHLDCLLCLLNQPNPPLNAQVNGMKNICAFTVFIEKYSTSFKMNHFGDTPLHGASARGHYDVVETLLKGGANPNIMNNNGGTPEMLAMNLNIKNLLQKYKLSNPESLLSGVSPEEYEDDSD